MKIEKHISRIVSGEYSNVLKISKLQTLALKCLASSPNQKAVITAYQSLQGYNINNA